MVTMKKTLGFKTAGGQAKGYGCAMTRDDVLELCASLPGAAEVYPFGDGVAVFRVGGRMFALVPLEGGLLVRRGLYGVGEDAGVVVPDGALELGFPRFTSSTPAIWTPSCS
jgi:hypothetical protein